MRTLLPSRSTDPSTTASARNVRQRLLCVLVCHRRGSGDDTQRRDLPQVSGQLICYAVGKVLLVGVAGEIFHGQNRNGVDTWLRVPLTCPEPEYGIADRGK